MVGNVDAPPKANMIPAKASKYPQAVGLGKLGLGSSKKKTYILIGSDENGARSF